MRQLNSPECKREASNVSRPTAATPERMTCRDSVEAPPDGTEPVIAAPLTVTDGDELSVNDAATVRCAVPVYVRGNANWIVHVPGAVCA